MRDSNSYTFLIYALILLPLLFACSAGNIQSQRSSDLDTRRIKRIAVIGPVVTPAASAARNPLLASPEGRKAVREEPQELLNRQVYAAMVGLPVWQIVSDSEVREIAESVPSRNDMARLKSIGEQVHADAVLTARVHRFRERVGDEWGAKSPASVAFSLDLIDVKRGDVVWSARFDETQKGLSENILSLGDIRARGIRWLTAEQLMQDGVRKVVTQLHEAVAHPSS